MEQILLSTLARPVRLATDEQLAVIADCRTGTHSTLGRIQNHLRRLEKHGWVVSSHLALKVVQLQRPIFRWRPGELFVEAHAIAWIAARRVAQTEPRHCTLYRITKKGARRCGAGNVIPQCQPTQIEHDLGCAAMFIAKLRTDASVADRWVGEDEIRRQFRPLHPAEFRKIPDAALVRETDEIELFLEFCGQYTAQRIQRFHRHCARHRIPYEMY